MIVNLTKQILKEVQEQPKLHFNEGGRQEDEEHETMEIEVAVEEDEPLHALVASAVSPVDE